MTAADLLKSNVGKLRVVTEALSTRASDRMTLTQLLFFLVVAEADLDGKPLSFTGVRDRLGDMDRSTHTSYRVLLEPSERLPSGLGWVTRVPDPKDERIKYLRLTDAGKEVLRVVRMG